MVDKYGMAYSAANAAIVEPARGIPDETWEKLPVVTVPLGTVLHSNFATLNETTIDRVASGDEPLREGYPARLYRTESGDLHIVDGHHRVAIYAALGKDLPARIATELFEPAVTE